MSNSYLVKYVYLFFQLLLRPDYHWIDIALFLSCLLGSLVETLSMWKKCFTTVSHHTFTNFPI